MASASGALQFGILGPLEVRRDDVLIRIEASRQRALLTALLLNANQVVPIDRLYEYLWVDCPPSTARTTLHGLVSRLRVLVEPASAGTPRVLLTRQRGYLVQVEREQLDLHRFEDLVEQGRRLAADGAPDAAARAFRAALSLWRGPLLVGISDQRPYLVDIARLKELRLVALEERIIADLLSGRDTELVAELGALVTEYPLRERLWEQLMLALYRAGRQAEALDAYQRVFRLLDSEVGVRPGQGLQRLQRQMLAGDPSLVRPMGAITVRVGPGVPRQLPAMVANFTGRVEQLKQLDALADAERTLSGSQAMAILVMSGMAGVGKTALAVCWGHRAADRFPDGQLYLNLRGWGAGKPLPPIEALAQLLSALGVEPKHVPAALEAAAATYRTLVAGKRLLVVLDNAISAEQVRPLLPGSATCLVIVTSRNLLAGLVAKEGAAQVRLDALPPEDAVTLLGQVIGANRMKREPVAGAELARLCGHLPLALRIAATTLVERPDLGIADLAASLRGTDRLARLAVDGDPQATVRAAFDRSYESLEPPARRMFRLLGLVPGADIERAAAAALFCTTPAEAQALLDRLAAAHLLERHADRFTVHDLLYLYAYDRARQEDGEAIREAALGSLLDWYMRRTYAAVTVLDPTGERLMLPASLRGDEPDPFMEPAAAIGWLDTERANLIAAARTATAHGRPEVAWSLADMLRPYFLIRRLVVEWLAIARAGLGAAESAGDRAAEAAMRSNLAQIHWSTGDYSKAIDEYSTASALAHEAGWHAGEAFVHRFLAAVLLDLGQPRRAAEHVSQALEFYSLTGRRDQQANCRANLGVVCWELGNLDRAARHFAGALEVSGEFRSSVLAINALTGLGVIEHARGEIDSAIHYFSRALQVCGDSGSRYGTATVKVNLAGACRDAGRYAEALSHAEAGLALARDIGDRRGEAEALNAVAAAYLSHGRYTEAVEHYASALRGARTVGARYPEVEALLGLAAACAHRAETDEAADNAEQGLRLARACGYRALEGHALAGLADIHLRQGDESQAVRHAEEAIDIHRETGHRLGEARARSILRRARPGTAPATSGPGAPQNNRPPPGSTASRS